MFENKSSFLGSIPPVVRNLLVINVLLWLATYTFAHKIDLNAYLGMHYWQSEMFNPAQIITYMFMHANFSHLFFNMFGLWMFGRILENVLGPKRFLFYYITCGIGAAIVQQLFWYFEISPIVAQVSQEIAQGAPSNLLTQLKFFLNQHLTIGASGSVFGLLLAFGFLFPDQAIYLMFIPIPIKAKYFVVGYAVVELFFGVVRFSGDNVAHFAHLGGLVAGFLVLWYWRKNPMDKFKQS